MSTDLGYVLPLPLAGPGTPARRGADALVVRNGGRLLEEITEVESGMRNDRPELRRAICRAKVSGPS